jgi:hypothetical protein
MGIRAPNHLQSDRPESGGADKGGEREKSGLLARQKEKFAVEEAEKARASKARASAEEKGVTAKPVVDPASRKRGRR